MEHKPKQLHMVRSDHQPTPGTVTLPEGYRLRVFTLDDMPEYLRVMHGAGFTQFTEETAQEWLHRVLPDGWFVVEHTPTSELVATALCSLNTNELHPAGGELGWVAADSRHRGRGLGMAVCTAVIHRFRQDGYRHLYLLTDDWRLPAIYIYLKLGFVPFLCAADMHGRWQAVCEKLGWPFTPDAWPLIPIASDSETCRPDSSPE